MLSKYIVSSSTAALTAPAVVVVLLLLAGAARAQEGAARVAVCNPASVFAAMDERKAIQDRINGEQEKIKVEVARRRAEVDELRRQLNDFKPGSPQHADKQKALAKVGIEFQVWAQLTEAEMLRTEKDNIRMLFDKIIDACREVAEARKIDLVLAERRPELPADLDQLKPDQVRQILSQRDVLYMNKNADITEAVILLVNKKYAVGAGTQK